jgi:hypothetical protein
VKGVGSPEFLAAYKAETDPRKRASMWRAAQKAVALVVAMLAILFAQSAQAGQIDELVLTTTTATNDTTASGVLKGHVEAIRLVIPAATTTTVSVATSQGFTLFSRAAATAGTTFYRPRFVAHTNSVTAVAGQLERAAFADTVTVTFSSSTAGKAPVVGIIYEK